MLLLCPCVFVCNRYEAYYTYAAVQSTLYIPMIVLILFLLLNHCRSVHLLFLFLLSCSIWRFDASVCSSGFFSFFPLSNCSSQCIHWSFIFDMSSRPSQWNQMLCQICFKDRPRMKEEGKKTTESMLFHDKEHGNESKARNRWKKKPNTRRIQYERIASGLN